MALPTQNRQKFGRPVLQDMLDRQGASSVARYVTQALLRASPLLQLLPFDDTVQVNAGQRLISYSYIRRNLQRVAQLRDYNTDYKPAYAQGQTPQVAYLKPVGDAFEIDRVFGDADEQFEEDQINAMGPAVAAKVADLAINGNSSTVALEPDGLAKLAADAGRTEAGLDLSPGDFGTAAQLALRTNIAKITSEVKRQRSLGLAPVVLTNADAIAAIELAGQMFNAHKEIADAFGINTVPTIADAPLLDVGVTNSFNAADVTTPPATGFRVENPEIIPTVSGATDIAVVGMSRINGFTGVTVNGKGGTSPVRYATARTDAGVLRRTELEVVIGFALLDERAVKAFTDVALSGAL